VPARSSLARPVTLRHIRVEHDGGRGTLEKSHADEGKRQAIRQTNSDKLAACFS
jgi:hypothetical protein